MRDSQTVAQPSEDTVTLRVPRSLVTVVERPIRVSQRNSLSVLGIEAKAFLALVRCFREAGGDVVDAQRLRLVEPDAFLAWLRRRERAVAVSPPAESDASDTVDDVARELGLTRGAR